MNACDFEPALIALGERLFDPAHAAHGRRRYHENPTPAAKGNGAGDRERYRVALVVNIGRITIVSSKNK